MNLYGTGSMELSHTILTDIKTGQNYASSLTANKWRFNIHNFKHVTLTLAATDSYVKHQPNPNSAMTTHGTKLHGNHTQAARVGN